MEFLMRREILATAVAFVGLIAAALPAAAEGCGGSYIAQSSQPQTQQTAQVQTEAKSATQ
jgi:hypothetical protein